MFGHQLQITKKQLQLNWQGQNHASKRSTKRGTGQRSHGNMLQIKTLQKCCIKCALAYEILF